jgi:hypothetical protein
MQIKQSVFIGTDPFYSYFLSYDFENNFVAIFFAKGIKPKHFNKNKKTSTSPKMEASTNNKMI